MLELLISCSMARIRCLMIKICGWLLSSLLDRMQRLILQSKTQIRESQISFQLCLISPRRSVRWEFGTIARQQIVELMSLSWLSTTNLFTEALLKRLQILNKNGKNYSKETSLPSSCLVVTQESLKDLKTRLTTSQAKNKKFSCSTKENRWTPAKLEQDQTKSSYLMRKIDRPLNMEVASYDYNISSL